MTSVQIKGVPEQTLAVLRQRAACADQSLQEYLLGLVVHEASTPGVDEVLQRASLRAGSELSFAQAIDTIRDDRHRR